MSTRRRAHMAAKAKAARELAAGALAGPLFVAAFSVIGAARSGYDWRPTP